LYLFFIDISSGLSRLLFQGLCLAYGSYVNFLHICGYQLVTYVFGVETEGSLRFVIFIFVRQSGHIASKDQHAPICIADVTVLPSLLNLVVITECRHTVGARC
jgi:hypothetical protein